MTQIQFTLPDDLAKAAAEAGLLAPSALETMLRDQLRAAGTSVLEKAWASMGDKEPSPQDEIDIADAIRAVRAERKAA